MGTITHPEKLLVLNSHPGWMIKPSESETSYITEKCRHWMEIQFNHHQRIGSSVNHGEEMGERNSLYIQLETVQNGNGNREIFRMRLFIQIN